MAAKRKSPKRPAAVATVATVTDETPAPAPAAPALECQALELGYSACQCGGPLCGSNVTE